jgi:protein-tyrosine phosphatase
MSGLTDIHAHVLPGIDDGPVELARSLDMLAAAADSGTSTIAATPHLRSDFPDVHVREIADRCDELRDHLANREILIELVSGAEVSLVWALEADDEELALASYGQRGADLLIETPQSSVTGLEWTLYSVRSRGYRITLAHPERSPDFQDDPGRLTALAEQGVLLQVNADTLLGDPRRSPTCKLGRRLLLDGLVHVLASDGHRGDSWRPVTNLALGVEAAASLVGPERARWMAAGVPAAVLAGAALPPDPPIIADRRRGLRLWR